VSSKAISKMDRVDSHIPAGFKEHNCSVLHDTGGRLGILEPNTKL
jgi:hypothetical protein